MVIKRKRLKVGDVLELKTDNLFAYLQFIGRHAEYGDAVLVSPRLRERYTSVTDDIFLGGYVIFYPVTTALVHGLVGVVAHLPPANLPQRLRRAGARFGPHVKTWIIEDESGEVVKRELSEEDLRLPIAAIWNHELLIERITEGWNPTQEGRES